MSPRMGQVAAKTNCLERVIPARVARHVRLRRQTRERALVVQGGPCESAEAGSLSRDDILQPCTSSIMKESALHRTCL